MFKDLELSIQPLVFFNRVNGDTVERLLCFVGKQEAISPLFQHVALTLIDRCIELDDVRGFVFIEQPGITDKVQSSAPLDLKGIFLFLE